MNLRRVYRFLLRTGALALFEAVVTRVELLVRDYRYHRYREQYDVHEDFLKRRNEGIELYGDGDIRTGPGSYVGRNSRIRAGAGTSVTIGAGCPISHHVAIYATSWNPDQEFDARTLYDYDMLEDHAADVVVEDDVWIGYNVFVGPGTHIGENSVVGANAVVTGDIPPHSIAAGAPARVLRFKSYVPEERKRELAEQYRSVLSDTLKHEYEPHAA